MGQPVTKGIPYPGSQHPGANSPKKETLLSGVLTEAQALDLLEKASPRPWKLEITRLTPMRIDIFDAKGIRVCHFHSVEPKNEKTPNWENDARFIIHLIEVINTLKQKENPL